jgi:hypothetical protein
MARIPGTNPLVFLGSLAGDSLLVRAKPAAALAGEGGAASGTDEPAAKRVRLESHAEPAGGSVGIDGSGAPGKGEGEQTPDSEDEVSQNQT